MPVEFTINKDSVAVSGYTFVDVAWNWIDDMEALSENFGDWPVLVFKQLVQTLGKIHANKELYMELL